ncbi:DNA cytosine methyltransferase [Corynebacterium cystitidis]|uniref:DNA cytosine methyltransferase n=1 Tax=Corynebacterium cystitidis TaxID=35757 RepID=UPI00211E4302|nr:DNA cytosine methyltransferase [Corynebacterium cystitidis]
MIDSPLIGKAFHGVEVFAGGGGLLLGGARAGINHRVAVEWDKRATSTMRRNAADGHKLVKGLNVIESDVREVDWSQIIEGDKGDGIDQVTGEGSDAFVV